MNTRGKIISILLLAAIVVGLGTVSKPAWEPVLFPTPTPTITPTPVATATPSVSLQERVLIASNGKLAFTEVGRATAESQLMYEDDLGLEVPYMLFEFFDDATSEEIGAAIAVVDLELPVNETDEHFYVYFYGSNDEILFYAIRVHVAAIGVPLELWDRFMYLTASMNIPLETLENAKVQS